MKLPMYGTMRLPRAACFFNSLFLLLIGIDKARSDVSSPYYYDQLRMDPELRTSAKGFENSNLFEVKDIEDRTFRLADISGFFAHSMSGPNETETRIRGSVHNDAAAALLAMYHFNNIELSPIVTKNDIPNCNVRMTLDLLDTNFSPIESTRLFTEILQRNHSITTPLPVAVAGAYRSATTSPLAILTGVNDIPQASYASTSSDFDVKEQYPLFGRTVPSSGGEAKVALDLFLSFDATHVGVLFVTDAFGSALQKAFQDAASDVGIFTDSVAFSFSADPKGPEIRGAVESLGNTLYRMFYVICFEQHYEPIMNAAFELGLVGDEFLWVFVGFDMNSFVRNAAFPTGSPLAVASRGVGLLEFRGGVTAEPFLPGVERIPPLEENPASGYQKFRTAWRQAAQDQNLVEYFRSKLPSSLDQIPGFDRNAPLNLEPTPSMPLVYDVIMAFGLSMCRISSEDEYMFQGPSVFEQFRNLDFEGASGRVKIDNITGTRDYTTNSFMLWNVQEHGFDDDGNVRFRIVPTNFYEDASWKPIAGKPFIFADGSEVPPVPLPAVDMDYNYIGSTGRIVGYALMGIVVGFSVMSLAWLVWYRNERAVRCSQPMFLVMVSLGTLIMASSIFPLSLEETVTDRLDGLDTACMAAPWLYIVGGVVSFSAMFAKTWGIRQAFENPELDFIHISSFDIFITFSMIMGLNLAVMLPWTLVAPLEWTRIYKESTDIFDRFIESYGTCTNDEALEFLIVVLVLNLGMLVLANWWAYRARNIETEYHESRYIGISMASVLQAWCMGIPILIVVWDNPQAKFYVQAGIVFVTAQAILLLIYTPKVLAIRADRKLAAEEDKRKAYLDFMKQQDVNGTPGSEAPALHVNGGCSGDGDDDDDEMFDEAVVMAASAKFSGKGTPQPTEAPSTTETTSKPESWRSTGRSLRNILGARGALKSQDADGICGIKVLHNPRSDRHIAAEKVPSKNRSVRPSGEGSGMGPIDDAVVKESSRPRASVNEKEETEPDEGRTTVFNDDMPREIRVSKDPNESQS